MYATARLRIDEEQGADIETVECLCRVLAIMARPEHGHADWVLLRAWKRHLTGAVRSRSRGNSTSKDVRRKSIDTDVSTESCFSMVVLQLRFRCLGVRDIPLTKYESQH